MKRKYFKKYLISCSVLLSLLVSLLLFWGYSSIKSGIHHDEQIEYINEFERMQKNIENAINISIAIGQFLTESDAVTTYASENGDYNSMDFYNIKSIVSSISSTQTTFSNLHLDINLFNEYASMIISGSKTTDNDDYYKETGIKAEDIISTFDKNNYSGYYYQFMTCPGDNNIVYLACQRIYADSSMIYLCISFSTPEVYYIPNFYKNKSLLISGNYTDSSLIHISEKAAGESKYLIEEEQRLTEYLLSRESEKALLFLNQILARALRENQSKVEMSNFRILMLNSVRRLLHTIDKTPEELFPEPDILNRLESCEDNEKFRNSIVMIFKTMAHAIQHDITQRHAEITNRILEYIQENLDKDLSMNDICNEFGMSSSTVARRLKENNISFKSYLNDQRINKAKELMREHPELMIKDIAIMTGFNNVVSFNRLFKKYEKISPGQYIENLLYNKSLGNEQ